MPDSWMMKEPEVRRRTGLSHATIWRLRKADRFPKAVKLSDSAIGWPSDEVFAWIDARLAERNAA